MERGACSKPVHEREGERTKTEIRKREQENTEIEEKKIMFETRDRQVKHRSASARFHRKLSLHTVEQNHPTASLWHSFLRCSSQKEKPRLFECDTPTQIEKKEHTHTHPPASEHKYTHTHTHTHTHTSEHKYTLNSRTLTHIHTHTQRTHSYVHAYTHTFEIHTQTDMHITQMDR
jgi:hypothetical protein